MSLDFEVIEAATEEAKGKTGTRNPHLFRDLADAFLMDLAAEQKGCVRYYQGRMLRYDGRRYLQEEMFPTLLRRYFLDRKIPHNNNIVGNVVPIIEARTYCDPIRHPALPFWVGGPPCEARNVVAFANGLLDVERAIRGDHDLMPHSHKWVSLTCLPHAYDPTAGCPTWLAFLEETLEGDQERIALLQEFFGYCLIPDNSLQKLLILRGVSRGGKGTVVKVLEALLGSDNMTGYTLTSLADKFGLGGLVGKLVASVGEVNLQGHPMKYQIFERLNNITGEDPVEVEYKHNPIKMSLRLPVRFVVSCNQMPHFADDSGALAERILVIDFERACPPERRDPGLAARLIAEASGITNWAIRGLARLRGQGRFTMPAKSLETLNDIRRKNSSALAFAQDRLIVHRTLDTGNLPGVEIVKDVGLDETWAFEAEVRKSYNNWCEENDAGCNLSYLFANLQTLLPKLKRGKRSGVSGKRENAMIGVRLKPATSP
jgi:putative DNA primase/helicase